jgi:hypothetical protein
VRNRTIKIIPNTDIIEIRYAGPITYRYRVETLEEIQRLRPDGLYRTLVNYTSAWPAPSFESAAIADFADRLGRLKFAPGARVALVNAPSDVGTRWTTAVQTQAGFLYREFHDRALAIEWLGERS